MVSDASSAGEPLTCLFNDRGWLSTANRSSLRRPIHIHQRESIMFMRRSSEFDREQREESHKTSGSHRHDEDADGMKVSAHWKYISIYLFCGARPWIYPLDHDTHLYIQKCYVFLKMSILFHSMSADAQAHVWAVWSLELLTVRWASKFFVPDRTSISLW